ncbi:MAG: LysR family transcriptional regulator [Sneathiellales bacterium]|nr:LysR family transcriptional regulator [Sneathiellales bacterium]
MKETDTFDWDDLKYFLAVVDAGTLRGGAARINANHVTVARRISLFEEKLGSRLFDRSRRGFVLTQLGEDLLPHAKRVEEEILAASRAIAGRDAHPSGVIRVSFPHALAETSIMEDLARFSVLYPDIELDISMTNNIVDLTRREADVSIRVAHEVTEDVVGRRLVDLTAAFYCSLSYAETIQDNEGEGLYMMGWFEPDGADYADWILGSPYPKAKLRHRVREIVPQLSLAAAGMGMARLACCLGDRHPGLVRAPFQKPTPHRSLWLLLHKDLRMTARIRLFVDYLAREIRLRENEFCAS